MYDAGKFPKKVRLVMLPLLVAAVILPFTDAVPDFFSEFVYGLLIGLLSWELSVYLNGRRTG